MGKYRTIVVDPPWAFDQSWGFTRDGKRGYMAYTLKRPGKARPKRSAIANYEVLSLQQIAAIPLAEWADSDGAHLYLWTTNAFMVEAHDLAKAWGFKVKTILTWVKPRLGMGTYYRNTTEHVLFGVRGSLKVLRHDVRTAFTAEQGRHSEKPATFYDIVQSMSPGPYLDVFARKQRFGWDTWGNECFTAPGLPEPKRS